MGIHRAVVTRKKPQKKGRSCSALDMMYVPVVASVSIRVMIVAFLYLRGLPDARL